MNATSLVDQVVKSCQGLLAPMPMLIQDLELMTGCLQAFSRSVLGRGPNFFLLYLIITVLLSYY